MRSRVEVVADVADDGAPVLVRLHAEGALAVRRTGAGERRGHGNGGPHPVVHLVGTAAGPLTGDVVEVDVEVRPGAGLTVAGVAATIALPGPGPTPARWEVGLRVGEGARVVLAPEPLVVCAGAALRTTTTVSAAADASVDVLEQVVLGRYGEPGGQWSGRLVADVGGAPVVRQTQDGVLLTLGPHPDGVPPRAVVSRLLLGPAAPVGPQPGVHGGAVRLPLAAGGVLLGAVGVDLSSVSRDLDTLARAPVAAAPS